MIGRMRRPPSKLVERLVRVSEEVLRPDPALRLEDVATLIGYASRKLGRYDEALSLLDEAYRESVAHPFPEKTAALKVSRCLPRNSGAIPV